MYISNKWAPDHRRELPGAVLSVPQKTVPCRKKISKLTVKPTEDLSDHLGPSNAKKAERSQLRTEWCPFSQNTEVEALTLNTTEGLETVISEVLKLKGGVCVSYNSI